MMYKYAAEISATPHDGGVTLYDVAMFNTLAEACRSLKEQWATHYPFSSWTAFLTVVDIKTGETVWSLSTMDAS